MKVRKLDDRHSTPPVATFQSELASDAFLHAYRRDRPDLGAIVLYATDSPAHRYWRGFEPSKFGIETESERPFRDAIRGAYRQANRILSRLFQVADERTVLLVVSDHGTVTQGDSLRSWVVRPQALVKHLDLEGQVTAFSVGQLVEIQPQGASPAVTAALPQRLQAVRVGQRPLFEVRSSASSWSVALSFDPDPADDVTIDGRQVRVTDLLSRNDFDGTHTIEGIVALWGPPVRKGATIEHATLRDVAPTVLALLACPTSRQLSGRILGDALELRWSERLRAQNAFPAPLHRQTTPAKESPAATDEVSKKLKALGYLH